MTRKKRCGIISVIIAVCAVLFGVTACAERSDVHLGDLEPVGGIVLSEKSDSLTLSWGYVTMVEEYVVTVNDVTITTQNRSLDLRATENFTLPQNGILTVTIVAKAKGYTSSKPVNKTFVADGVAISVPQNISIDDGVISWVNPSGALGCVLTVEGKTVSDGADGLYHAQTYDASALSDGVRITLAVMGDGVWLRDSETVAFILDKTNNELDVDRVSGLSVDGETLSWQPYGGATAYRVIDIDYNVTTVTETSYDMSDKNLVIAVYPVIKSSTFSTVALAEGSVVIDYLEGKGTATDPYKIKTPFDLRAIDYYENIYAQNGGTGAVNNYKIMNDINYDTVSVLEDESNMYTLRKPFYGVLDGDDKKLSNVSVNYDGGYWALFDLTVAGSVVKNIRFDSPTIVNVLQHSERPINASIATVANINRGTVSGITVDHASYTAAGGEVCGIVSHNYGTVTECKVTSSTFTQGSYDLPGQACYEMAGIVTENCAGGVVSNNVVSALTIAGTACEGDGDSYYYNVRTAGGIVAVNRAGGSVSNNGYDGLIMTNMLDFYNGNDGGYEWGGLVAYNAGTVVVGASSNLGTFTWNGESITRVGGASTGASADQRKKDVGKNDGTVR